MSAWSDDKLRRVADADEHASIVDKLVEPEHRANTARLVPQESDR